MTREYSVMLTPVDMTNIYVSRDKFRSNEGAKAKFYIGITKPAGEDCTRVDNREVELDRQDVIMLSHMLTGLLTER